jgi:hypothetical protein
MLQWLRAKLFDFVVNTTYRPVSERDLLRFENGTLHALGRPLEHEEKERLQRDAQRLKDSMIWQLITDQARIEIYRKSVNSGLASDSSRVGLFIIAEFEKIIQTLSRLP